MMIKRTSAANDQLMKKYHSRWDCRVTPSHYTLFAVRYNNTTQLQTTLENVPIANALQLEATGVAPVVLGCFWHCAPLLFRSFRCYQNSDTAIWDSAISIS